MGVRARPAAAVLALLLLGTGHVCAQEVEVRVYPIGLGDLRASAEVARALLSPEGRLAEDPGQNRLVVVDHPVVHARIAAALSQLQGEVRNVRITVTRRLEETAERRGVEVSGGVRAGGVEAGVGRTPPPDGIAVRGGAEQTRTAALTSQQLLVLSGHKATIEVAERVPYTDWFREWGAPYGLWRGEVRWEDVGASMVVEPVIVDESTLRIRLAPAFSVFRDRERMLIEVQRLATEVVVREGEELDLGGVPMESREFLDRFLLGFDEGGRVRRVRVTLRAEIQ